MCLHFKIFVNNWLFRYASVDWLPNIYLSFSSFYSYDVASLSLTKSLREDGVGILLYNNTLRASVDLSYAIARNIELICNFCELIGRDIVNGRWIREQTKTVIPRCGDQLFAARLLKIAQISRIRRYFWITEITTVMTNRQRYQRLARTQFSRATRLRLRYPAEYIM